MQSLTYATYEPISQTNVYQQRRNLELEEKYELCNERCAGICCCLAMVVWVFVIYSILDIRKVHMNDIDSVSVVTIRPRLRVGQALDLDFASV